MAFVEDLLREYRATREETVKHQLIMANLPLVKYLAGRLMVKMPMTVDQEDLESYGIFGLLDAVERYNPDMGTSFKSYAYSRIKGAMIDEIRKLSWVPRSIWQRVQKLNITREELQKIHGENVTDEMIARALGITLPELHKLAGHSGQIYPASLNEVAIANEDGPVCLEELIRNPDSPDPLDIIEEEEGRRLLAKSIGELSEKDQLVLSLYYQENLTLKEISKVLEVSESRVCQLHARAIKRLRENMGVGRELSAPEFAKKGVI